MTRSWKLSVIFSAVVPWYCPRYVSTAISHTNFLSLVTSSWSLPGKHFCLHLISACRGLLFIAACTVSLVLVCTAPLNRSPCYGALEIVLTLLSRRSRQRERLNALGLSICSSVCLSVSKIQKNAIFSKTKQFRAIVSIYDLYEVVHRLFKEPIIGPLKFKMAEIRHLENRHDVYLLCWRRSNLDIISQTGAEWPVDCGDMVEIETRNRILIYRTFWGIQWHIIPELRATLQGERIPSAILTRT